MDVRRAGRPPHSPMVRQVGFVTPGSTEGTPAGDAAAADLTVHASSPTPVMIPPPKSAGAPPPGSSGSPAGGMLLAEGAEVLPGDLGDELEEGGPMQELAGSPTASSRGFIATDTESLLGRSPAGEAPPPQTSGSSTTAPDFKLVPESIGSQGRATATPTAELTGSGAGLPSQSPEKGPGKAPPGGRAELRQPGRERGGGAAQVRPEAVDGKEGPLPGAKATTKAERRAKQEAERAAKAAKAGGMPAAAAKDAGVQASSQPMRKPGEDRKPQPQPTLPGDKKSSAPAAGALLPGQSPKPTVKKAVVEQTDMRNRVELFKHLPQYERAKQLRSLEENFVKGDASHPHIAVYEVGLSFVTGAISGGNARCIAMLNAFREMIKDYTTPPEKVLVRDLTARINAQVNFLITCRPLAIGMGNAIRFVKQKIAKLPGTLSEAEAKGQLVSEIDRFVQEKIVLADKEIVRHASQKIRSLGDVLLTYSRSHVVEQIFLAAHEEGKRFRVVVVDASPRLDGKKLLTRLVDAGIECTYVHINAVSYIMQEVTRVFLGASGVLANGVVYAGVGSAAVGMVAHSCRVPVLVCCESYKFHERVQLDSITFNELGDPDELATRRGPGASSALAGWAENPHLQLLNLVCDVMPAEYVTMIVTEIGMVPPTSVPVILREYRKDMMLL